MQGSTSGKRPESEGAISLLKSVLFALIGSRLTRRFLRLAAFVVATSNFHFIDSAVYNR